MKQIDRATQVIGKRYIIHRQIGHGGMGTVYHATDPITGRDVALKRVTASTSQLEIDATLENSHSETFRLGLAQEFRTLATLRHPHIISVLDYGFDDGGQPFFTMDLLDNASTLLDAVKNQTLKYRINLLIQMLQAIAYLHRRGIIHRDLKPGNVLVTNDLVKVLDFGLAITHGQDDSPDDELAGTLAYIAPEVLMGQAAQEASDLYAIGVMTYELFTGRHPFEIGNAGKLISAVISSRPDLTPLEDVANKVKSPNKTQLELPNPVNDDPETEVDTVVGPALEEALKNVPELQSLPQDATLEMRATHDRIGAPSLVDIVDKLLTKTPEERYQDAYDVINDLCTALNHPIPEESAAIRESFLQAAKFVGRQNELNLLEAALSRALAGRGSAWLIEGESGVGKSRLIDELRIRAMVKGVTVITGQAVTGGGVPYQLWREPLRRIVLTTDLDDLDAGILKDLVNNIDQLLGRDIPDVIKLEGEAYQQRLQGTIASIFQRQAQPILLVLEDLQWLNESLDIVQLLTGMAENLPILIIGSYRVDDRPNLPDELPNMNLMKLERLTQDGIADLSVSMLGDSGRRPEVIDLLQRETEGNIFFMVEVVRALAEEAGSLDNVGRMTLPEYVFTGGVQAVLKRRLSRVPESDRSLLQLAAATGRELDTRLLNHMAKGTDVDDWLMTCSNCAVLEIKEGTWRFAHDKLREAVLQPIAENTLTSLHKQVAEALETTYPNSPEHAATLTLHWHLAGDGQKECHYAQQAGNYALQISALDDAIRHFKRALVLLEKNVFNKKVTTGAQAAVYCNLGEAIQYTGDYPAAIVYLEKARDAYKNQKDNSGIVRALNLLGDVAWQQGDYQQASQFCQESLALAQKIKDPRGIAHALNRIGMVALERGNPTDARESFEKALNATSNGDSQAERVSAMNNLGLVAYSHGEFTEARTRFEESLALCRASGERRRAAAVLNNLGGVAGIQQDFEAAIKYFEESLRLYSTIGERRGVALGLENLGIAAFDQGEFEHAQPYFEESLTLAREIGNRAGEASILIHLGNIAKAREFSDQALHRYRQSLRIAQEIEAVPLVIAALTEIAPIWPDPLRALEFMGMVLNHPATDEPTRQESAPKLAQLKSTVSEDVAEARLEQGKTLDIDAVVAEVLSGSTNDMD